MANEAVMEVLPVPPFPEIMTISLMRLFLFFYTKDIWNSPNINSKGFMFQRLVELVNSFHSLEHELFYDSFHVDAAIIVDVLQILAENQ
jgi:hypothetical protein